MPQSSAFRHFIEYGINEFRAPNELGLVKPLTDDVNLLEYAKANHDLLLAFGISPSATSLSVQQQHDLALHFHRWGYAEGRPAGPTLLVAPSPDDDIGPADEIWVDLSGNIGMIGLQI